MANAAKLKSGSRIFAQEHGAELQEFFREAQIAYASGSVLPMPIGDSGQRVLYTRKVDGASAGLFTCDPWEYEGDWYGGEPHSGLIVVRFEGVECFSMVYWGRVMPYAEDKARVMAALMDALRHPVPAMPWRGPRKFLASNGLKYINQPSGSVRKFDGHEEIVSVSRKQVLYSADYIGGIINQD